MSSDVTNESFVQLDGAKKFISTQTKIKTSTIERHIGSIRNVLHLVLANLLTQCIFQTQGRPHLMKRFCVSLLVRKSDPLSVTELLRFC